MASARDIVSVFWIDTSSYHRWIDVDEVIRDMKPKEVLSFGVLIAETPEHVLISPMWADDDDFNSVTSIPRGTIKGIKKLGTASFDDLPPTAFEAEQAEQK